MMHSTPRTCCVLPDKALCLRVPSQAEASKGCDQVMFHQSGGCRRVRRCYPRADFLAGDRDISGAEGEDGVGWGPQRLISTPS